MFSVCFRVSFCHADAFYRFRREQSTLASITASPSQPRDPIDSTLLVDMQTAMAGIGPAAHSTATVAAVLEIDEDELNDSVVGQPHSLQHAIKPASNEQLDSIVAAVASGAPLQPTAAAAAPAEKDEDELAPAAAAAAPLSARGAAGSVSGLKKPAAGAGAVGAAAAAAGKAETAGPVLTSNIPMIETVKLDRSLVGLIVRYYTASPDSVVASVLVFLALS